jgi:adenylate kinase
MTTTQGLKMNTDIETKNHLSSTLVFISGTPGVGKSTVATLLQQKLSAQLIRINEFAEENGLFLGEDDERGYKIVDLKTLCKEVKSIAQQSAGIILLEGHLSHFCPESDLVIVLRAHPSILEKRLKIRTYQPSKIQENLEAEALAVCSVEAHQIHQNKVHEIDTSDLTPEEVSGKIIQVINGKKAFPAGNIDFLEWIMN